MNERQREQQRQRRVNFRVHLLMVGFVALLTLLAGRAGHLQLLESGIFLEHGEERHLHQETLSAHRGSITDRHGEYLALSTPVDSIWANPSVLKEHADRIPALARALDVEHDWLLRHVTAHGERQFLYLRRHLPPARARAVLALDVPGVDSQREYKRYYPAHEVTSHVLGFTSIDDEGLEGIELAFDYWLRGDPGKKLVLRDRLGRSVEDVSGVEPAKPGRSLVTSIDLRLQYVAYRALKGAIARHDARSGSAVILDVESGEVLAMVNQPSYNPNDRGRYPASSYRNRAVTDIFEPGSAFKTMIMAAALQSGAWRPDSRVDTAPGFVEIGGKVIKDTRNLGAIDATTVLVRSSNVGITRIAQTLEPQQLWRTLNDLGFGQLTTSGFPGESAGLLRDYRHWRAIGQATLSYGYGLSVTPLQLAQAYAVIGNGGVRVPISFIRQDEAPSTRRVLDPAVARHLVGMLEAVVEPGGTGTRAAVPGYRIAGKTGTARKSVDGGYATDRYVSVFAGLAPASRPKLATVVLIDEPSAGAYYGGDVAAPVFAAIVGDALRLLAIAPDAPIVQAARDPRDPAAVDAAQVDAGARREVGFDALEAVP